MPKNWKSLLAGLGAGIVMTIANAAQNKASNPNAPPLTFNTLAPGIAIAVLGMLTKDHDVTGGTRANAHNIPILSDLNPMVPQDKVKIEQVENTQKVEKLG